MLKATEALHCSHQAGLLGIACMYQSLQDSGPWVLIDVSGLQSFCRKFVWHRECLWPEELPEACMLVLAGEDDLVPSALVKDMLHIMNHPCEVSWAHSALCLSPTLTYDGCPQAIPAPGASAGFVLSPHCIVWR